LLEKRERGWGTGKEWNPTGRSTTPTTCTAPGHQQEKEPLDTGGDRVFSFDATFGLMATCWRRWRQSGSSAPRSAAVV